MTQQIKTRPIGFLQDLVGASALVAMLYVGLLIPGMV